MTEEIEDPKAVLAALDRAKADAKKYREELAELRTQFDDLTTARDELLEQAKDNKWHDLAKEMMVKASLGANADRLIKFVDLEAITLDDAGEVNGLDEELTKVKTDLPELFDTKRQVGGAADLYEKGDKPAAPTGSEAQVRRIFNSR